VTRCGPKRGRYRHLTWGRISGSGSLEVQE
jgi:hypothetical protein